MAFIYRAAFIWRWPLIQVWLYTRFVYVLFNLLGFYIDFNICLVISWMTVHLISFPGQLTSNCQFLSMWSTNNFTYIVISILKTKWPLDFMLGINCHTENFAMPEDWTYKPWITSMMSSLLSKLDEPENP